MVARGRILRESEQLIAHFQGLVFESLAVYLSRLRPASTS